MKNNFYQLLDVFTFGKGIKRHISGFSINLPTRYHKYFESDYELNNINFINNYLEEDMVAIDIGAHIGLLTAIMAQKVGSGGKVFAFEPTPSTFKLLEKTIKINGQRRVAIPFQKAVASKSGSTTFYITAVEACNSNSLSTNKRETTDKSGIKVDLISIDELVVRQSINRVDLIKIDAEGAEFAVLEGCVNTIQAHKPKIILGIHPLAIINFGDSLSKIWDFVTNRGYKVYFKNEEIKKDFFISQDILFDVFLI